MSNTALSHMVLMILVNIWSGKGLLSDSTKQIPESILTFQLEPWTQVVNRTLIDQSQQTLNKFTDIFSEENFF